MRRTTTLIVIATALVAGCKQAPSLPASEVLRRSAQVSQDMLSARFDLSAGYNGSSAIAPQSRVTLNALGWMQQSGKQLATDWNADITAGTKQHLVMTGSLIVADIGEVYLKLSRFDATPDNPVMSVAGKKVLGMWLKLPSSMKAGDGITPDPRLLQMEMAVIDVVRDDGIVSLNGTSAYHYVVSVNQEKLLAFLEHVATERKEVFDRAEWVKTLKNVTMKGDVWIDASTFSLLRATWNIAGAEKGKEFSLTFDVLFSAFNAAPAVSPPTGASSFTGALEGIMMTLPGADQMLLDVNGSSTL